MYVCMYDVCMHVFCMYWVHCHPLSAFHEGVLSNRKTGESDTGPGPGNRVGVTSHRARSVEYGGGDITMGQVRGIWWV